MAQVSYPGVYIQEVPSGVHTVTSVSTSVAAFLGRTSEGQVDKAVRLLSYADYERNFGVPHSGSDVAASVDMFFANGGSDCYVVRLAKNAVAASVTLKNLSGVEVLVATAKTEGVWGNNLRLEIDYNTSNPDDTFNLRVIHVDGNVELKSEIYTELSMDTSLKYAPNHITDNSSLISLSLALPLKVGESSDLTNIANSFAGYSQSRRHFTTVATAKGVLNTLINTDSKSKFKINVDGIDVDIDLISLTNVGTESLPTTATNIQSLINTELGLTSADVNVSVEFATSNNLLTITSNGSGSSRSNVTITAAAANDISVALMLGIINGGIEPVRYSNFRPAPTASIASIGNLGLTDNLNVLSVLQTGDVTLIDVDGETIMIDGSVNPVDNIQTTGDATDLFYESVPGFSPGTDENDGVREKLNIIATAINNNTNINFQAAVWGYTLAVIPTSGDSNGIPSGISTSPTSIAGLQLNTRQFMLGSGGVSTFSVVGPDGDDGAAPESADYLGSELNQTGFHALDPVDLFNLMILPGDTGVTDATMASLWGSASFYCKSRRAFLLVDPPSDWTDNNGRPDVVQNTTKIDSLRATMAKDYSAVFYPRLALSENRIIAPAGAIAGLMARTDASRGVWKAPAGINAGITGIGGVNLKLTDAENGVLNKKGVNCIRVFPNGIVNWGGRTLDGDDLIGSEWKYISVRRLALMIEESLFRGTKWVVFEGNDEPLWAQIRMNLGAYMNSLFRQGAFQGSSPKQAYYVKCDKETTTQNDINQGIVNIEVGFAPLKPAEFVVIKIQQMSGEL